MIKFGRDITNNFEEATTREWFVTNGIGGYASGTISGALTRRYHGLLIAALDPPLKRTLLVSAVEETASYQGKPYELSTSLHSDGRVSPEGFNYIESFWLDGTVPSWLFNIEGARLFKQIWMRPDENTTYIRYELISAESELDLEFDVLVNCRDHHRSTNPSELELNLALADGGATISGPENVTTFLYAKDCHINLVDLWRQDYLRIEDYRGFDPIDHNLNAIKLSTSLDVGESVLIVMGASPNPLLSGEKALEERRASERKIQASLGEQNLMSAGKQLALAADQFIVRRSTSENPKGRTVLAGYPWFADWGRDTMIALPGLTLATGRPEIARNILQTYSLVVDQGMLPNRFTDDGESLEYNTVDATLWFFIAIHEYIKQTDDLEFLEKIFPILQNIIDWHIKGTRYNIKMDPIDGLLYAGNREVQLTWMDAKVGDWVVTPRTGKAVEINALWYNTLIIMGLFAEKLQLPADDYRAFSVLVEKNFKRFWNHQQNMCFDVIDGPDGEDPTLRPNQIFAVSLPFSPLPGGQQRAVVDICEAQLLTPYGLRSLAPDDERYVGVYAGSPFQRDGSYHQGTVWGWLIGPFVRAHLKVYQDKIAARRYLVPLLEQLETHGLGSVSEIFDGDAPFTPRGCFAQAWSVAELICALEATK